MANLPPRPKSPPMLTTRDRVASAQPMACRPRDDRHPPNRSSDIYFPSYREGRRDDRDRDRYRDHDRRDRYRRDWTPPSRRRDSPDRDRRPPHRGPLRRYPSPRRGSYYRSSRSRSPPPLARRSSRSPRRHRSPTRSRSHSPRRSPKVLRQYSATNSPRSRSPLKRRHSRSRSHTPPKPPAQRSLVQETDSKSDILDASIPPLKKEEPLSQCQISEPPKLKEEEFDTLPLSETFHTHNITPPRPEQPPTDPVAVKVVSPEIKSEESRLPHAFEDEVKSEPTSQADTRAPRSPRISSTDELSSWSGVHRPPRSPPRGPRGYHSRGSNIHGGSRGSKRRAQGNYPHSYKKWISLPDGEHVDIPVKLPNPILDEMDKTVISTRRTATKLAMEILQQSKHLSRQLHEFQLASMDLRAAESRRKLSELHLEKARNGALGIDYSEEAAESKT